MNIGEKIRLLRKKAGLTQKELGQKLGISQAAIGQFETNRSNPQIETLQKIASALDVPVQDLLPDTLYNRLLGDKAITAYSNLLEQIIGAKGYTFGITEDDDSLYINYPDGILKINLEIADKLQEDIESYTDFKMQELKNKYYNNFIPKNKFNYKTRKVKFSAESDN